MDQALTSLWPNTPFSFLRGSARLFIVRMNAQHSTKGQCSVEGCSSPIDSKGLCNMHYSRKQHCGYIGPSYKLNSRGLSPEAKLLAKRKILPSGCWEWTGYKRPNGYGNTSVIINGRCQECSVHRLAAYVWNGFDLRSPLQIRHTCDHRFCINPQHLLPGTSQDNENDKVERGRQARGEKNGCSKFTEKQVTDIRRSFSNGEAMASLARKYKVAFNSIWQIAHRKTWKHIP